MMFWDMVEVRSGDPAAPHPQGAGGVLLLVTGGGLGHGKVRHPCYHLGMKHGKWENQPLILYVFLFKHVHLSISMFDCQTVW